MTPPKKSTSGLSSKEKATVGATRVSGRIRGEPATISNVADDNGTPSDTVPQTELHDDNSKEMEATTKDDYPNFYYDPDPLPSTASDSQRTDYLKLIHKMGEDTLDTYRDLELDGEDLWIEFIAVFRPHTIKLWNHLLLSKWIKQFRSNGVHVARGRASDKAQKLVDLLYREKHICAESNLSNYDEPEKQGRQAEYTRVITQPATESPVKAMNGVTTPEKKGYFTHPDRIGLINNQPIQVDNVKKEDFEEVPHTIDLDHKPGTKNDGGPPDDDDNSSGSEDNIGGEPRRSNKGLRPEPPDPHGQSIETIKSHDDRRSLGINGLMKAFQGKQTFSGCWEEDLDNCINVYNTLALMCEVTPQDKMKAIPVMLTGDALNYYANNSKSCSTFDNAISMLRKWYNSDDRKARILTKWQSMKLSEAMNEDPKESEATVFRNFTASLMSLQNQLDDTYHDDKFLRDRLLTAVDIPSIQSSLRDRLPRTSQQAINRVAIQLSDRKRSAGSNAACTVEDNETFYSLGKTYGGEAIKDTKKPWSNRSHTKTPNHRDNKYNNRPGNKPGWRGRRLSSEWMRGVKGCFVCGQDHMANNRHSREEVTAAINRLKSRHPSALLTIEDLSSVVNMVNDNDIDQDKDDGNVMWNEEGDESEDSDITYMLRTDADEVERSLSRNAFLHGRSWSDTSSTVMFTTSNRTTSKKVKFNGITIDTAANRKSVMCEGQYLAYQLEFGRKIPIRPPKKGVRGIGGRSEVIGEATIQIPFLKLHLIIDVEFSILKEISPSLLSNRDMIENGLDISLQGGYLYIGSLRQPLILENYFYTYNWSSDSIPYVLYTEKELRTIHRSFGHPSVSSTYKLLKRASNEPLAEDVKPNLRKLANECKICRVNAAIPRRFKLTVGSDELRFNNRIYVDTMFIEGRPVIHIVDESTHFSAAAFLRSQSTSDIWKAILSLWTHTYMGPPTSWLWIKGQHIFLQR